MDFEDIFNTSIGKVLGFLIIFRNYEYRKTRIAKNAEISYKTLHNIWSTLEELDFIKYTRTIGRSKYYKLNTDNELIKPLIKLHFRFLMAIADEYIYEDKKEEIITA